MTTIRLTPQTPLATSQPASTRKPWTTALTIVCSALLSGCAVVAVADAAVTVVATGVKVGAKAVGAAADMVIPDGD